MNLRLMTKNDHESVIAVWKAAGLNLDTSDSQVGFEAMLARNPTSCFVAETDGQVVGAVLGGWDGRRGYIYHLGVHPDHQKQGVGTALVQEAVKSLAEQGVPKVWLALDSVELMPFYKKLGFHERPDVCWLSKICF